MLLNNTNTKKNVFFYLVENMEGNIFHKTYIIMMSSCVGGSKAPPRTISQQDTRCECYINNNYNSVI